MKNTIRKWIALLLTLCMLFVCGAALGEEAEKPLAVVNGVNVYADEAAQAFAADLEMMYEGYSQEEIDQVRQDFIYSYVVQELLRQKVQQLGMDQFTEEELAGYRADAENQYENMLAYYMDFFAEEGLSEEEVRAQTVTYFEQSGYTLDSILQETLTAVAQEKLYEQVTSTVMMDDAQLQVYYEARVAAEQAEYQENLYSFEYALSGESVVTYIPEGFRSVRALLVRFQEEDILRMYELMLQRDELAADSAADSEQVQQVADEIQAICQQAMPTIEEVQNRLAQGEDFLDLMAIYNEDEGMEYEPFASRGYYVSQESVVWPEEFVREAMALTQPGQVSQPIITYYGIYLLRYEGDVTPGPVPLEEIHDQLMMEAMESKKAETYDAAIAEWYSQAEIVTYPENLAK